MEGVDVLKQNSSVLSSKLLMIEPTHFGTNYETMQDNSFMKEVKSVDLQTEASKEFHSFVAALKEKKIDVVTFKQPVEEAKDAVFPNNWFSTHRNEYIPEGLLIIYPLKSPNRRLEKNAEIIERLKKDYTHFIDLSYLENEGEFLESTGCLVFDIVNRKVYCGVSERASPKALDVFMKEFNKISTSPFELITFNSVDAEDRTIYHTNVVMGVLSKHILICLDSIKDKHERSVVENVISESKDKKLIEISIQEMSSFGGNVISVKPNCTESRDVLIISRTAYNFFSESIRKELDAEYDLCIVDIPIIEQVGGGSARCMVAEIY